MSDQTEVAAAGRRPYRRGKWRKEDGPRIPIGPTKNPATRAYAEPVPDPVSDPAGDRADTFTALYPEEIDHETRNVRMDMSFSEVVRIRDQAQLVMAAMQEIIEITKDHKLGSIKQRRQARHTAATASRALSRFNNKTPYGEYRKKS